MCSTDEYTHQSYWSIDNILSKEDIESLGWIIPDLKRPYEYQYNNYYLQVPNSHPFRSIRIYEKGYNGTWVITSVDLIIKNKEELKKLMYQINIIK